jgi:cell division cycle 20-like protein 1 (cofactor of APC complex)
VLDAPNLQDDFYLNLLDWSKQDVVAVGLGSEVYLRSSFANSVHRLCDLSANNDVVTSVKWSKIGSLLAVGTGSGKTLLWDVHTNQMIKSITNHSGRVGSLDWNNNILASGSKDNSVAIWDSRTSTLSQRLLSHKQEVCGLKWSYDQKTLASGGNDNKVYIWEPALSNSYRFKFSEHCAAVKALAWSPYDRKELLIGA